MTTMGIDLKEIVEKITEFIRTSVENANAKGAILGLSGGIDSSVTAFLSAQALGNENVLGILLPEKGITREEDVEDALRIAKKLGIEHKVIEISEIMDILESALPNYDPNERVCHGNLKARIRMCILYYYANLLNRLVIGTGNRTEILLGYTTKYGDAGVDILPLGELYKMQVRALAMYLGVPEQIIRKAPSAGLWVGQTDEEEFGCSYELVDAILKKWIDEGKSYVEIEEELNISREAIEKFIQRVEENKHKRETAPTTKIWVD
ncbi:MAG: NAD+ synthase [Methanocellales archaeon]|nr:NAD+ synthase [Methanocellales archaeon]MDD3291563.1 NAD+ synthase [Methanocellales archaeon]MDD5235852.1 NAD+ synthase [Methanocellales archaeon]MDD5485345.1 NAD+ synthase [Methanocellales archaeon]